MKNYTIKLVVDEKWLEAIRNLTADVYEGERCLWLATTEEETTSTISEVLEKRNEQVLAVTDEDRDEMDENNPVVFAESGPNRFRLMSMFFEDKVGGDNDGVQIQEDVDTGDITVKYFTDKDEIQLTEGAVFDWAVKHYEENF